jgi:hypothetical protein
MLEMERIIRPRLLRLIPACENKCRENAMHQKQIPQQLDKQEEFMRSGKIMGKHKLVWKHT